MPLHHIVIRGTKIFQYYLYVTYNSPCYSRPSSLHNLSSVVRIQGCVLIYHYLFSCFVLTSVLLSEFKGLFLFTTIYFLALFFFLYAIYKEHYSAFVFPQTYCFIMTPSSPIQLVAKCQILYFLMA